MMTPSSKERLSEMKKVFAEQFGGEPTVVARAPGRVNLIGEHTDYNEGFVFPAAIDREMLVVARPASGSMIRVYSLDYGQSDGFDLNQFGKSKLEWSNYLRGVLHVLKSNGHAVTALDMVLSGNVPQGAGLSSSAAYEVAIATLINYVSRLGLTGQQIALLAQKAENEFIGVQCGIMDQFISALGHADAALLIDCRSLEFSPVMLNLGNKEISIVITNSGVRRGLVDSEYNARRSECEQGVRLLSAMMQRSMRSLRELSLEELKRHESQLPPVVAQRCRHVVSENERVLEAMAALENANLTHFGKLMNASHASLRDDYQVSCAELDRLVALTQAHPGVLGARMTGAGFGGCTVALIENRAVDTFKNQVIPEYEGSTGKTAEVYVCSAVAGAEIISTPLPV